MKTAAGNDVNLRRGVVPHAKIYDPTFNQDVATPPASLPVLDQKTARATQAENVGFEELSEEVASKQRDLKSLFEWIFKPFLGGTEKRMGPLGRVWEKMERLKIQRNALHKNEYDPDQEIE